MSVGGNYGKSDEIRCNSKNQIIIFNLGWAAEKCLELLKRSQQAGLKNTRVSIQLHKIFDWQ
jgi:hypothetical protein